MNWLDLISIWETRFIGVLMVGWFVGWFSLIVIDKLALAFKAKRMLFEYIWHRDEFRKWMAGNCEKGISSPAASKPQDATATTAARNIKNDAGEAARKETE